MGPWSMVRWVRAASFAATCAGLATLGHVAGGGCFRAPAVLAGFLLVLAPALALTGRERTLRSILPATALAQVLLHVLLGQAAGHHAMPAPPITVSPDPMGAMHYAGSPGPAMLLMHAVGVLVSAAWLEWGEARLCALVRHLAGWALRPLLLLLFLPGGPGRTGPRTGPHPRRDERAPVRLVLRYAVVRRGPPGAVPALAP
ncbi:hypothetical protein [Actinomadura macrotermitis]|uniref:Uncharacterized protein n=1 Tax=Actinomadura macrotermitis TaxID=2585200 RepID=A0A7K0C4Y1_9ACTN|nr:hypothetical protein [Actinomadura macrotermitis]MQY08416.1 hypothetical protein [Actinomadura macrotermitis]